MMKNHDREVELITTYTHIAETFADLHDTPTRMYEKNVIRKIVKWEESRVFFYWRLLRRMIELRICNKIKSVSNYTSNTDCLRLIEQWYDMSHATNNTCQSDYNENDEGVYKWLEAEEDNLIKRRINALEKMIIRSKVSKLASNGHAESVAEGMLDVISALKGEEKEKILSVLRRGILFRSHSSSDVDESSTIIEF